MLCAGPKLEDFLSGGSTAALGRFGVAESNPGGIYDDSELKIIAAGFLGFPADGKKAAVAVEAASGKKGVDTFGQRTSIYRGVTRSVIIRRCRGQNWK